MNIYKYSQLIGTFCGGLLIYLPIIPQVVMAQQTTSQVNPCPRIFYEEPHNNRVLVPQGCPPNALTLRLMEQGLIPVTPLPNQRNLGVGGESPPAPEQRQEPSARIALVNDKANIVLINDTGANVTYQVIGDTAPRILAGKSRTNLRGLSTPITVTFQREDRGLLMVTPKPAQEKGTLEVTLKETTDVNQDKSAMRIQANGEVFLN
ncbi:hypothetical protein ACSQ6I_15025 [Anabaena sp. WFMT]|uniref:hypothetical protein n=1 Tax=Anabaena sp. WFMT TaxID=3449730 RepID=UPI003F27DE05